jgi:D-beta-D-heptose 7-phosphate kinase/D-beta-D-heptose 1-phosphate adenosyltransferase
MVRLTGIISQLKPRKILVVGDLMLDTYTIGKARRISPEAPVAVIHVQSEENRPGGAGNVVLNLKSLGAEVSLIGRLGSDSTSDILRTSLAQENIDMRGLFVQEGFFTPMKNRVIADNQQIVRVDYEQIIPLPEMLEQKIIEALPVLMEGIEAIAISDYGKGFLSRTLLSSLIELARSQGIPIITDPKGSDFTKYQGTTIIKPNLSEAYAAAGLLPDSNLDLAAPKILELANAQTLMVTRSEAGISIFQRTGERYDFPVRVREIKDVTGAGDTVLAMLTYALANGLTIAEAAQLSNVAAGIAIEHIGCARIRLSELARRLLETDLVNKIFDKEHLFALQEALKEKKYILLGLSGSEGMTTSVFSTIHHLAKDKASDLVVFLRDIEPNSDFVDLLASLQDVKFIIVQSDNIASLCENVPPSEIHMVSGKKQSRLASAEDLFKNCESIC